MKFNRRHLSFLLLSLLLLGTNEIVLAGIFSISERQEIMLGKQAAIQVERSMPIIQDKEITQYVTDVGNKLVANSPRSDIPYRFRVIKRNDVNAFALPGGFIYIHSGLIEKADNESEFVGVMAHEVAHVVARHGAEQAEKAQKAQKALTGIGLLLSGVRNGRSLFNGAQLLTKGVFLKFSRDAEREADIIGAVTMHKAGWNADGMITFFEKLAASGGSRTPAFFSTHPSPKERHQNIGRLVADWHDEGKVDSQRFQEIRRKL
jgi:predicted Zn-dependent protease